MPYRYKRSMLVQLTTNQRNALLTWLSGVWDGVPADIDQVTIVREPSSPSGLVALIDGTKVATTLGELPAPPFEVTEVT